MKKLILISVILLSGLFAQAQITLEHYYSNPAVMSIPIRLTSGYKYVLIDTNNIYLYNLNHSLFRTIPIPHQNSLAYPNYVAYSIFFISDMLFDTDSTNIEYMIYNYGDASTGGQYFVKIYREDGTLLLTDTAMIAYPFDIMEGATLHLPLFTPIVKTDSGTKMILIKQYQNTGYDVYPALSITPAGTGNPAELSNPIPNPSANAARIGYTLPEGENSGEIVFYRMNGTEAKRFKVDRTFDMLYVNNSDLSPGTYFYQLTTANNRSSAKKMVVIR